MSAPLLILVLAGIALLVVHIRANRETITATEFREDSVYDTAVLSDGTTAYRDLGPREAPVLVIIHGATLGSVAYEEYYEPFLQGGYRVVAYDEYGRGFSDRIRSPLDMDCMRRQLLELLDHLHIDRAVLYGISLGGAIAARFGAAHPDRVTAIGYQVPLIRGATSPLVTLGRIPLLNRFLMRVLLTPKMIQRGEAVDTDDTYGQSVFAHFRGQFSVIGTEKCLLSMLTGDMLGDRLADHDTIARAGTPVQFAYATDDPEIAPALVEEAIAAYSEPDVARYTGGHFFSTGRQTELAAKLLEFLKQDAAG
jgi:pimeloyl-ACP methyl ester carboxylesterase